MKDIEPLVKQALAEFNSENVRRCSITYSYDRREEDVEVEFYAANSIVTVNIRRL